MQALSFVHQSMSPIFINDHSLIPKLGNLNLGTNPVLCLVIVLFSLFLLICCLLSCAIVNSQLYLIAPGYLFLSVYLFNQFRKRVKEMQISLTRFRNVSMKWLFL